MADDRPSPNRQRAAELLRKLRTITVEAGATEAEALTAATKARQTATEHDLSLDEDPIVEVRIPIDRARLRPIDRLWPAIGAFTQVSVILIQAQSLEVVYAGRAADTLLAEWLHALLTRHIARALADFKLRPDYRRRKPNRRRVAAAAFVESMTLTLCTKLCALQSADARAKAAAAERWIADRYQNLSSVRAPTVQDSRVDAARLAGHQAARGVPISPPVTNASVPLLPGSQA
ncbi:DUF7168 domain-containing protein [Azospirillum griseum]|uniref:DUF7168 domain-containing protein n=1 Tax=Azospirillum griseum TaxID=2496639 RepID=UPI0013154090|nr:hypothetical protein [Azospirillum griseum]